MDYSETYSAGRHQYRFNYDTGELEQLGRLVAREERDGRMVPVVRVGVIQKTSLTISQFIKAPEYWVQLYDSQIDRK